MDSFTAVEKETVEKEVKDRFSQLVLALNQMNADEWSQFYSQDGFLSAIAGTAHYAMRKAWVDAVIAYFSTRERQRVEPLAVRVAALAPDLALLTSEERSEMALKSGEKHTSKHVFTMVWRKEAAGWKILHSHESWTEA